jgi:hypothetical protein
LRRGARRSSSGRSVPRPSAPARAERPRSFRDQDAFDHCLRQQLSPPSEQLVAVHIMAPAPRSIPTPRRLRLRHHLASNASEYCRRFVAPAWLMSTKLLVDTCSASPVIRRSSRQSALSGRRPSPSAYCRVSKRSTKAVDNSVENSRQRRRLADDLSCFQLCQNIRQTSKPLMSLCISEKVGRPLRHDSFGIACHIFITLPVNNFATSVIFAALPERVMRSHSSENRARKTSSDRRSQEAKHRSCSITATI